MDSKEFNEFKEKLYWGEFDSVGENQLMDIAHLINFYFIKRELNSRGFNGELEDMYNIAFLVDALIVRDWESNVIEGFNIYFRDK